MSLVDPPSALPVLVRLAFFAAQAVLFGLLPVVLLSLRPGFAGLALSARAARSAVAQRVQAVADVALAVSALAVVLGLLLQAGVVARARGTGLDGAALAALLDSEVGRWQLLRLPLLAALAVLLRGVLQRQVLRGAGDGRPAPGRELWWCWGLLATALLATSAFTGHARTRDPLLLHLAADLLHLMAAAAWLAGLGVLALVLPVAAVGLRQRDQLQLLARVVLPFSRLALVCIPVVAVTGAVGALASLDGVDQLRGTGYGQALVVKVWLYAWVVAFGGVNHLWLVRRLARPGTGQRTAGAGRALAVSVAGELLFGVLVLGATAVLVGLPHPG